MNSNLFGKKINSFTLAFSSVLLASTISLTPAFAQQIVPNGQSQTSLSINGATTNVTTKTIRGANAYNTFSRFNVDRGNTVNLHVPSSAQNLVNLIYDEKTNINGILNGLKNNQVGGNIVLINPHGIAVGSQGVVNVGSLTAITPTQEDMKRFRLNSDKAYTDQYKNMNINPDAVIEINGQVKSASDIIIQAGAVDISGNLETGATFVNIDNKEAIGFRDASKPQSLSFGSFVNVGSQNVAPVITLQKNNAGDITIKAKETIFVGGGKLNAKNGELDMVSENGDVCGYGSFKGDLSAIGDNVILNHYDGDLVVNNIEARNGDVEIFTFYDIIHPSNRKYGHGIDGNNITLNSLLGNIGSKKESLGFTTKNSGIVKMEASRGSIYAYHNTSDDLHLETIKAKDVVKLSSGGSIYNSNNQRFSKYNIIADSIDLFSRSGSIGTIQNPLKIASSEAGQNFAKDNSLKVTASAYNHIALKQDKYNMKADKIKSKNGIVDITLDGGNLLNGRSLPLPNIEGKSIYLLLRNGSVGNYNDAINIKLNGGYIDVLARNGDVNINHEKGDLNVGIISTTRDVTLNAEGSILDAYNYESPNVTGANVSLYSANGTIGTSSEDFNINSNVNNNGDTLTAIASNGLINLEQHSNDLFINQVYAGGSVTIKAQYGIYSVQPGNTIDVMGNDIKLMAGKIIGTSDNPLGVKANGKVISSRPYGDYINRY